MVKSATIDKASTHGHALFLYSTADERVELLADYFKHGLAKNELCVLATADSQEDIVRGFMNVGFDVSKHVGNKSLRIYEMNATYVPNGQFVANYMLSNVNNFIESAKEEGYKGLRTAGEMGWVIERPESVDDAIDYEHKVNSLTSPDTNFIGVCLYPMHESYGKVLQGAIDSHPSFIYDGQVTANPHFIHT